MNHIHLDFISLTVGYVIGVFFCWSLCELIHGEKNEVD